MWPISLTVAPHDPAWPEGLRELERPPALLRVAGTLPPPTALVVGIVGTRHADDDGRAFAYDLARDAAALGHVVISGGARGIDGAAHEGAVGAGGRTVVVLPGGLHEPYPRHHRGLFARVVGEGGCLVTEYDDDAVPFPSQFLERNRLIAAWADVLVVVQAPARSGALSTARAALRLGRPVYAVPLPPWDPRGAGCLGLLRQGARPCAGFTDLVSVARRRGRASAVAGVTTAALVATVSVAPTPASPVALHEPASPDLAAVLRAVGSGSRHLDEVVRRAKRPVAHVLAALTELVLAGWVEERAPQVYVRAPRTPVVTREAR